MAVEKLFLGRLAVQQRVLPAYRAAFFNSLATCCSGGLSVFAGQPQPEEQIPQLERLENAELFLAHNRHLFKISSPFYQCWQAGIIDWLKVSNPDALIVEANPRYPSTRAAVEWMHTRGRPVLGWGLGAPQIHGILAGLRRSSRRRFLSSLDGLIVYSQRGAQEYQALGIPAERIFVAPNAAASRPAAPPTVRPPEFKQKPVILFVGRLQQRKRIDLLLRACAALPAPLQPRLQIIGDGPARSEFETLASQIYPQAEFLGSRYGSDLEASFRNADLFVLPGTGGLAVQQAMSFGLPVIAAEGDGTQQDLVRPANGWQVPGGDLTALTQALLEALQAPARLRKMGAESYRIVAEEVNVEQMVKSFVEALNGVSVSTRITNGQV